MSANLMSIDAAFDAHRIAFSTAANPSFMAINARQLKTLGIELSYLASAGKYQLYSGNLSVSNKGEIFFWQPA